MEDPDNEDRLLKIPPHVRDAIRAEAIKDCIAAVETQIGYCAETDPMRQGLGLALAALRGLDGAR